MGDLRLRLNQTQRVRLEAALHELQILAAAAAAAVTFADNIPVNPEDTILKGHGTSDQDGEVVATVCGVVERVQNLVCVRTLRARYKPQKGDIVIGRVSEIASKRWRLEINFSQGAVLMLSSMNLPDGIQAEVRHIQHDGSLDLQPRSQKYGKLQRGQLLTVPAYLVKRRKQHFHHLEQYDADLILGCNGFIWVGEHVAVDEGTNLNEDQHKLSMEVEAFTPLETRRHICRLANAVRVLSALGFTLTVELIIQTAEASLSSHVEISDMLGAEFYVQTAEREAKRRADLSRRMNGPR
ncbi:unnamed protein product [Triticum turgidum subsp. durum]|uniref:K Homology domain-containing protein n=2 Tax=Triticum TaxID=4564 RepID=A0A9R1AXV1_TRITD|nr:unnamed protein product [Triticum turgidum subsp. durum]